MGDQDSNSEIMIWLKLAVLALPATVLPFIRPVHTHAQLGIAWIVGALLQALIPPRRKALVPILVGTLAFAIIYALVR
jgi:hypothetical protein